MKRASGFQFIPIVDFQLGSESRLFAGFLAIVILGGGGGGGRTRGGAGLGRWASGCGFVGCSETRRTALGAEECLLVRTAVNPPVALSDPEKRTAHLLSRPYKPCAHDSMFPKSLQSKTRSV